MLRRAPPRRPPRRPARSEVHAKDTDRKLWAVALYPAHGRARPTPPPPPVFWREAFFAPEKAKKGVPGRGARRGPARRGPTCTPLRDLPASATPAARSGLAEHLAPTRRPARPPRAVSGAQRGRPDAARGPGEAAGRQGGARRPGRCLGTRETPLVPRAPCTLACIPRRRGAPGRQCGAAPWRRRCRSTSRRC